MKRSFVVVAVLGLLLAFSGCKKVAKAVLGAQDFPVPEIPIPIQPIPIISSDEVELPVYIQHYNLDSTMRANSNGVSGISDVSSIKMKKMDVRIISSGGDDLSNFSSVRLNFSSNANTNGADVFSVTFTDSPTNSATVSPSNPPELLPYFKGTELYYRMFVRMRRPTTSVMKLGLSILMTVK
jgi:hypothetical protein